MLDSNMVDLNICVTLFHWLLSVKVFDYFMNVIKNSNRLPNLLANFIALPMCKISNFLSLMQK